MTALCGALSSRGHACNLPVGHLEETFTVEGRTWPRWPDHAVDGRYQWEVDDPRPHDLTFRSLCEVCNPPLTGWPLRRARLRYWLARPITAVAAWVGGRWA